MEPDYFEHRPAIGVRNCSAHDFLVTRGTSGRNQPVTDARKLFLFPNTAEEFHSRIELPIE